MKTITEFPNYKISKGGQVWSIRNKIWLKQILHRNGYLYVCLCDKGKQYKKFIHKLVLETYVSKRPKGLECRHLNDNAKDNRLKNLKWGTHKENMQDTVKHRGRNGGNLKLSESDVRMIIYMWRIRLFTQTKIAKIYGVTLSCINHIIDRRTWKHIWNKSA